MDTSELFDTIVDVTFDKYVEEAGVITVVDAHAHLCDPAFDPDRTAVLERARAAGVVRVVAVGETLADAHRTVLLAMEHPLIAPAAGLYPTHLDPRQAEEMEGFIRAHRDDLVAIGEVGLDYWVIKAEAERERQRTILSRFIALSLELDLPLNVHSRSAGHHTVSLLLERGARRVLMHAFDGRAQAAMPAVEAGFYFSIPPSVVRSPQKQKLVRRLPLDRLLVETDSPVLGATPGERNEPANARLSLNAIAELKGRPREEVAEAILENCRTLFPEIDAPKKPDTTTAIW